MDQHEKPFDLSRARVCVILNEGSGQKRGGEIATALQKALAPAAAGFDLRRTGKGRDLAGMARKAVAEKFDLIIAAGGDGTQSAVAAAVAGSDTVMAVIPGGTFNYFARQLGVGDTIEDAIATILNARIQRIDLGEINGLTFLNNASIGAYPEILERRESIYRRWGRSRVAAYWSVLIALVNLRRPMVLRAQIDGKDRRTRSALAFVASSAYQLESLGLDGADAIRNGKFAIFIAKAHRPLPLIGAALRLAFGKSAHGEDFDMICTDSIEIEARPARRMVAYDGEKTRMTGPFRLRRRRQALAVLVPATPKRKGPA